MYRATVVGWQRRVPTRKGARVDSNFVEEIGVV